MNASYRKKVALWRKTNSQFFTNFIQTLKNNNLKIEISFKASSTSINPLTENFATVKSIKGVDSQLGLDFNVEE